MKKIALWSMLFCLCATSGYAQSADAAKSTKEQKQEVLQKLEEAEQETQPVTREEAEEVLNGFIRDYHRSTGF